jgi:ribosomal protein S8
MYIDSVEPAKTDSLQIPASKPLEDVRKVFSDVGYIKNMRALMMVQEKQPIIRMMQDSFDQLSEQQQQEEQEEDLMLERPVARGIGETLSQNDMPWMS